MVPAMVLAVTAMSTLVIAQLGAVVADRAQARTAADAGALAAATGGEAAATVVVERNGGVIDAITVSGDGIEVTVTVGRASASARAVADGPR
jgi:hypothetical protein